MNNDNEHTLIKKTIQANNNQFYVNIQDTNSLNEILFLIKLRKLLLSYCEIYLIDELFKENGRKPEVYNISISDLEKISNPALLQSSIMSIRKNIFSSVNFDLAKYLYLENSIETKIIKLFLNEFLVDLNKGKYFGDLALENKNAIRMASIMAKESTHLGFIYLKTYKEHIFEEKNKIRIKECMYYVNNFFAQIKLPVFKAKYFTLFAEFEMFNMNVICRENDELKHVYFIKEGEIELKINVNISQLNEKIELLSKKINYNHKSRENKGN